MLTVQAGMSDAEMDDGSDSEGGGGLPDIDITGLPSSDDEGGMSESDDESVDLPPPGKKQRKSAPAPADEDDDELALRLLEG